MFFFLLINLALFANDSPLEVLIVGAGPCGLSVAKAFQNRDIYPDIIEKEDQIRADGAGIAIPANGSWALQKLGIKLEALLIQEMQFTDNLGAVLAHERIDSIHPDQAQFFSLTRDALMQQLRSSLDPKTIIQTGTRISHFCEKQGRVLVTFSNGHTKSYDLVIGCDGIHSTLRAEVHPNETPEFLNLLVWRTVLEAPEDLLMPTYMLGADRLLLLYPLPDHKMYLYGHLLQTEKNLSPAPFSTIFSSFTGLVPTEKAQFYIHHMEKSHSVRFRLDGFSRILLVGDAAHAFGPSLQNGAAQAFEDAYVLQDLLANKPTSDQIPALLESFEKRRVARVQSIFNISNAKIQALSDPAQMEARNAAIRKSGAPNVNGFKLIMQKSP